MRTRSCPVVSCETGQDGKKRYFERNINESLCLIRRLETTSFFLLCVRASLNILDVVFCSWKTHHESLVRGSSDCLMRKKNKVEGTEMRQQVIRSLMKRERQKQFLWESHEVSIIMRQICMGLMRVFREVRVSWEKTILLFLWQVTKSFFSRWRNKFSWGSLSWENSLETSYYLKTSTSHETF